MNKSMLRAAANISLSDMGIERIGWRQAIAYHKSLDYPVLLVSFDIANYWRRLSSYVKNKSRYACRIVVGA